MKKKVFCDVCEENYTAIGYRADMIGDGVGSDKEKIRMFCPNNDKHYKIIIERRYNKIPRETKQKFMDLIKEGKTIGEARKEVGVSTDMGAKILLNQINHYPILSYEVKE